MERGALEDRGLVVLSNYSVYLIFRALARRRSSDVCREMKWY
jgi:hypothetical protein